MLKRSIIDVWLGSQSIHVPLKLTKNNITHIVLVPLFLTLNIFRTLVFMHILHISQILVSIALREGCTVKFFFQSISWNTNLTLISQFILTLNSNCFSKLSWNISVKEIFGFQKLKISFSEILQKKQPHASLILLF